MSTVRQPRRLLSLLGLLVLVVALLGTAACGDGNTATTTGPGPTDAAEATTTTTAGPVKTQPLLVAAAAGLKNAFTEIAEAFDKAYGAETTLNLAASGQLRKQIEGGAPADVFASADVKQMQLAVDAGAIVPESVEPFADNVIVLIVPADSDLDISDFRDLADPAIKKLATGDPEITPLGAATHEILQTLGIEDAVAPKLIYTQTVNQTLDYVSRGEIDAGVVWASEAQAGGDKVKVVATADRDWHTKVLFVIGVVEGGSNIDLSQAFVDFVLGPEAQAILEKHGFLPAEQ
jgi:molybdate transport system substrate-binding protein